MKRGFEREHTEIAENRTGGPISLCGLRDLLFNWCVFQSGDPLSSQKGNRI